MVKQKSAARKHDFNCIGSWLCTCKTKSPFEKARALLVEVYDNAKMCPEGHLSLTLAVYNDIKEFLQEQNEERPTL